MKEHISRLVAQQRTFLQSGQSRNIDFRLAMLRKLDQALTTWEEPLARALWHDLHKSYEEAYLTELSIIHGEIRTQLRHLHSWCRPQRIKTSLKLLPSRTRLLLEPLGVSLIIAPWNYPVQLLLNPLVGAIAAGCTALLKPSPYVPEVSRVVAEMIRATFLEEYVALVEGDREVNRLLLEERYDVIFFTGSPALGRTVMEAAARNLTPVVLELGGKSPCIVDQGADIEVAAKRIAWGKMLNAGQTCIAPDYLMIHRSLKEPFIRAFAEAVRALQGEDIYTSPHYARMVNSRAFARVAGYLKDGVVRYGGRTDEATRFIEPTLLDGVLLDSTVMQEEIFGPLLPIIDFEELTEVTAHLRGREKPLALYFFGRKAVGQKLIAECPSGGACINDVVMHIANERAPFGGVGNSGMGRYHGRESLLAFSHQRTLLLAPRSVDLPFRYMPYNLFRWVKRLL